MCVLLPSSRFFLSLGLVRFYSRSKEKKIPNRVAFYPPFLEGGISPFSVPFFLFHLHSSIFPNLPTPSDQFQFNEVVSLLWVNVHVILSSNSSSTRGSSYAPSRVLPQKSQLTMTESIDSSSSSRSISPLDSCCSNRSPNRTPKRPPLALNFPRDFSILARIEKSKKKERKSTTFCRGKTPGFETSSPRGRCTPYTRGRDRRSSSWKADLNREGGKPRRLS